MLENLKSAVLEANMELVKRGLVILTWGNVSAIDREKGWIVIKPSGVSYETIKIEDMVVVDLGGNCIEGKLKPSSDTQTHIALYRAFPQIGGIAHSHSTYATAWAQAGMSIPNIGTTHADYFADDIPCTRDMSRKEISKAYEKETGNVIAERFFSSRINPLHTPGVLVKNHGSFTWGETASQAVLHSIVLEEVAKMAFLAYNINSDLKMNELLIKKHFNRKHGEEKYYGQE